MRTPISNEDWEVTVVDALTHEKLIGESWSAKPKEGYIFVDVGVKIKNLDPEKTSIRLILNAEQESINSPLILQFRDVPLIQFSVER